MFGITPAKSKTLDVNLDGKSDTFKWYFLRGVIDGDGTINVDPHGGREHRVSICSGSKKFAEKLVASFPGANLTYSTTDDTYHVYWAGSHKLAELFKDLPYKTEDYFYTRKCTKIEDMKKLFKEVSAGGVTWTVHHYKTFDPYRADFYTLRDVAKHYGSNNYGSALARIKRSHWEDYFAAATMPPEVFTSKAVAFDGPENEEVSKLLKRELLGNKSFSYEFKGKLKGLPTSILDPQDNKWYTSKRLVKKYGIVGYSTFKQRIYIGWEPYKAATYPPIFTGKKLKIYAT